MMANNCLRGIFFPVGNELSHLEKQAGICSMRHCLIDQSYQDVLADYKGASSADLETALLEQKTGLLLSLNIMLHCHEIRRIIWPRIVIPSYYVQFLSHGKLI